MKQMRGQCNDNDNDDDPDMTSPARAALPDVPVRRAHVSVAAPVVTVGRESQLGPVPAASAASSTATCPAHLLEVLRLQNLR